MAPRRETGLLSRIGPGILLAATGVGAGDLATAAFAGSHLGLAVLWAVLLGAGLKLALTEGLARWQLATGETLLEGAVGRLGSPARILFPLYLLPWSFVVGSALMSACGVTAQALLPVLGDGRGGRLLLGLAHSAVGVVLALRGGYRMLERVMGVCVGMMFLTVVATALLLRPDPAAVIEGLLVPRIPDAGGAGVGWTVGLVGGVGGTLTILCYGYWIRERGRFGVGDLALSRLDLAVGYAVTAGFGLAMVVIGSSIEVEGSGARLIVDLAARLEERLGPAGRWIFLAGAWGAVFSSLLGVWQAVPAIFADFFGLVRGAGGAEVAPGPRSRPYRLFLLGLATVPALGLLMDFQLVQKAYAVIGALFLPLLAVTLLVLGRRGGPMGAHRNRAVARTALVWTLAFFLLAGWLEVVRAWW